MRLFCLILFLTGALCAAEISGGLIFPLEKWHNHSSSIVELPNGDLLVCWFHGSGERQSDDVVIRAARWNKSTGKWTEPFLLADTPGFPDTNPVLWIDGKQRLFLFWPAIIANQWETALMKYRISTDYQQKTGPPKWEHQDNILLIPKDIVAKTEALIARGVPDSPRAKDYAARQLEHAKDKYFSRMGWFSRTHPMQLASGRILLPLYSDGFSYGLIAISDDGGYSWTASQPLAGFGCIQPSLVRRKDGSIVAYMRDNGPPPKRAMMSVSKDDGLTWTLAEDTELLNPGTSLEVIALRSGNWLALHNDLEQGRWSLVAALSDDEGKTWRWRRHLDGRPELKENKQYHYPSVIQAKDGNILATYSYFVPEGKSIKQVKFSEEWVKEGDR